MNLENSFCQKYIDFMRFDKAHNSLPCILTIIIMILSIISTLEAAYVDRLNLEKLIVAVVEAMLQTILTARAIHRNLSQDSARLIELIQNGFTIDCRQFEGREQKLIKLEKFYEQKRKYNRDLMKYLSVFFLILNISTLSKNLLTHFLAIKLTDDNHVGNELTSWPTPFLTYHPPQFDSILFFLYLYTISAISMILSVVDSYVMITLVWLSSEKILADFQTIYTFLADIETDFEDADFSSNNSNSWPCLALDSNGELTYTKHSINLRKDMARILHCHQSLIRNFQILGKNSEYGLCTIIGAALLYNCVMAYFMLTVESLMKRMQFSLIFIVTNFCVFAIYYNGQRIFNQNDILRKTLAMVSWTDKPHWFKKALLLMISRANIDLEQKPFSIFSLNYISFKDLMKTIFSIGNVFYTKKRARQWDLQY